MSKAIIEDIYLDNSATTIPLPEVINMVQWSMNNYYNPSAIYKQAIQISKSIQQVREDLFQSIGGQKGKVIFTSGGTESINTALKNGVKKGKKIISTAYEHDATLKTLDKLEKEGYQVILIKPREFAVQAQDILDQVDESTAMVSLMHVNNETGHMLDIETIGKEIKKINPQTLFHVDGVQSYMKMDVNVEKAKIDFLSLSGHKIHGIKGTGALYARYPEKLQPLIFGGGQEIGLRSGTENVPGILALGKAVELGIQNQSQNREKLQHLKSYFVKRLKEIDDIVINSPENWASHIINVSFLGVPSEIMLHTLESKGIYVSSGSACSSKKKWSHVLESLRLKDEVKSSAIRFSFSHFNTDEEIHRTIYELREATKDIRKITKYKGKNTRAK